MKARKKPPAAADLDALDIEAWLRGLPRLSSILHLEGRLSRRRWSR